MVVKPTPVRASSVGNVGGSSGSGTSGGNVSTTSGSSSAIGKQSVQHTPSTTTVTTSTTVNTNAVSKTSSAGHHHTHHSHQHHNISQANTATTQSGNFAAVAATNVQHHTVSASSYSNKNAIGEYTMIQRILIAPYVTVIYISWNFSRSFTQWKWFTALSYFRYQYYIEYRHI